jgi:glycosyltransferase involved in cell wall biosynthesis
LFPTTPRISVTIPAYNAAWCIRRAVDSVLAQTYRDFELIVINDGSTDATLDSLAGYGDQVRAISKPNGGLSSARNAGISAARGEFVAFLDADDWWLPEKLARQVALLDAQPNIGFCSTTTCVRGENGEDMGSWECPRIESSALETIFRANAAVAGSGSAVMVRKSILDKVGGFDEQLRSLEDIDMWMRLAAVSGYACIPETLACILKRSASMSGNLEVMRRSALAVMKKNRQFLAPGQQGAFWRQAYAEVLTDYAKWRYRSGHRVRAMTDLLYALALAPRGCGRLSLGLLLAMARQQKI